jgi:recombinational DNA repair protein RecT
MAKKTVLIDLLRYAPKSVEVAQAASADNLTYRVNPSDPDLTMEADFDAVSE